MLMVRRGTTGLFIFCLMILCGCNGTTENTVVSPVRPVSVQPALKALAQDLVTPSYYKGALSWENAEFILHSSSVGRIITFDPDYPYSIPVSFGYCKERIYIHSAPTGRKITNIQNNQKVLFVVDRYKEEEGWASIHIFGQARIIHDPDEKAIGLARFSTAYRSKPDEVEQKASEINTTPPDGGSGGHGGGMTATSPMSIIEIVPEKVTSRILGVPKAWSGKLLYLADENVPAITFKELPDEDKIFQGILPKDTVKWHLYSCSEGRVNTYGKEYPYSAPVNYSYFDGRIYLHSKNWGEKLDGIKNNPKVSFSVDRFSDNKWFSINIFGEAKIIDDPAKMDLLMFKYSTVFESTDASKVEDALALIKEAPVDPKREEMMKRMGQRMVLVEITPHRITSKTSGMPLNKAKLPYVLEGALLKQPVPER